MRILIVSNLYPPNVVGGYERLCFDVTAGLAQAGHEMVVLTSRHGGKVADYPGQRILRELDLLAGTDIYSPYPGTPAERDALNRANLDALARTLRDTRPDVIFAWNLFFFDASLLDALQASGIRCVLMLTDNWLLQMREPSFLARYFAEHVFGNAPFHPSPQPRPGLLARIRQRLRPPAGPEAVFGSAYMRALYGAGGQHFARSRVIHNGVRQIPSATAQDRAALVEPGTLRLLFAGRLVDLKGAHTIIAALPLLDPAVLGVSRILLTLVGDTQDAAYMRTLEAAIAGSACADRIVLQEPVAESALPALFDAHDIYLFPSLYEPFSLTLIHALALGVPTVASDAGGNPEIVHDGETGLLYPKGDAPALAAAIGRLAGDGPLRARLAARGRGVAAGFTFERMVGEMAAFLGRR